MHMRYSKYCLFVQSSILAWFIYSVIDYGARVRWVALYFSKLHEKTHYFIFSRPARPFKFGFTPTVLGNFLSSPSVMHLLNWDMETRFLLTFFLSRVVSKFSLGKL